MRDLPPFDPDRPPPEPAWDRLFDLYGGVCVGRIPFVAAAARLRGRLVYLATPYSREVLDAAGEFCPARSAWSAARAAAWAQRFATEGVTAVSPIVQAVAMLGVRGGGGLDPLDAAFWDDWCRPLLRASDAMVVPAMPGWDRSVGVWREACATVRIQRRVHILGDLQ